MITKLKYKLKKGKPDILPGTFKNGTLKIFFKGDNDTLNKIMKILIPDPPEKAMDEANQIEDMKVCTNCKHHVECWFCKGYDTNDLCHYCENWKFDGLSQKERMG